MIPTLQLGGLGRPVKRPAAGGGGATDPYWSSVVSLLHFDGADGSTTFTDQTGKVWSGIGSSAQIDTAQSKFGGSALEVPTGGDYIRRACTADDNFGTGDFTIEFFRRFAATGRKYTFEINGNDAAIIITPSSGLLEVYGPGSYVINAGTTPFSTGTWYHLALAREGNTWRFFRDGVLYQSATDSRSWGTSTGFVTISGGAGSSALAGTGHWDEVRITKGVARYTAGFTVPSAAFPDS